MFRDYLINRLYLQKIKLKGPLSRGSHFNIYFHLECQVNQRSRRNFHEISFYKDRVLINPDHIILLISLPTHAFHIRYDNYAEHV